MQNYFYTIDSRKLLATGTSSFKVIVLHYGRYCKTRKSLLKIKYRRKNIRVHTCNERKEMC